MSSQPRSFLVSPEGLNQLQAAKARLNLSFAAIAAQAGVSANTVSRLFHPERGQRVSQLSIEAIAQVLELQLAAIIPGDEREIATEDDPGFAVAEQKIQRAIEKSSSVLHLSGLALTTVPASISQLIDLTELSLSQNHLTMVPNELGKLKNLTALDLHLNQLATVPKEVGQLKNLTWLSLSQNQLKTVPKEVGQLENLTELDLHQNQLKIVPKELGKLKNLTRLSLDQNQLETMPKELGKLKKLTELYLYNNQLKTVPKELGQLKNLTKLSFSQNQLKTIPEELEQLKDLTELYLYNNQLTTVPEGLGDLINLTRLSLYHNQLTTVPKELGRLKNLTVLSLHHNQLTTVPKELGDLTNLTQLSLSQNHLTMIPKELEQLKNLTELYLPENQLTTMPKELGQLKKLTLLSLIRNQIKMVPKELGQLKNLTKLYISENQLTTIPKELGKLENLIDLDLSQNQLITIPKELVQLAHLKRLYLHGNEKLGLPSEILGPTWEEVSNGATPANPQDILNYYFGLQTDRRPLNEAKLILVGYGAVGKTSLVNRLVHNHFDPNSPKTEGIQITQWPIRLHDSEDITLHVWDFGGQEIMHSTHQFFLTERSLYLLVLNGRQSHEDTDAEYWLELIQSFGSDSPVIVVLNKIKDHPFDVNRRALQQKFPAIRTFISTDCEANIGIDQLHRAVHRETDALEDLRAPFPASWTEIKNRLANMDDNYISFDRYRQICQKDGETDQGAQDSLAVHLHNLGIALNYKDDLRLRDTHVLNPHWVTNGIYRLLNAHELTQTQGELITTDLTQLLDLNDYPPERHGFLLELMRKFELCFRFADDDHRYLIPDLLDKQQPPEAEDFDPAICLNFRYDYPILPEGLLPRFIVRTHVLSEHALRWRTGVILNFEGNRALVKGDRQDRNITISVDGPLASRRRLLAIIRYDFDRIHSSFKFKPQEKVPVPGHPQVSVDYQELLAREEHKQARFDIFTGDGLLTLNVRDLLNGVDLGGSRRPASIDRQTQGLRLFFSYSHKDETLRDELESHLKILEREQLIQLWHDRRIDPGLDWAEDIDTHLNQADIILLLISADFINSRYCYEVELPHALKRHQSGAATVIPIIIRPADWQAPKLARLSTLPTDAKAVTTWDNRDAAWLNVETGIKKAINAIKARDRF